jgi:hypothetical protein
MTTKKKFDVDDPPVVLLSNNRYAYRVECPWTGRHGKKLFAFKFCSQKEYERFTESEQPQTEVESEQPQTDTEVKGEESPA